jgi:rhodanese-related sulfurtransferase
MIAKAEKSVKTVDMAALKSALNSKQAALLIDVREPEEYATGHLPGAVNIPRGVIEFSIWKHVGSSKRQDGGKKVYLYCHSGPRAVLATKTLQDLGLKSVFAVVMDIGKWKAAGHPFTK